MLLWRVDRMPIEIGTLTAAGSRCYKAAVSGNSATHHQGAQRAGPSRRFSARFPLILDDMVLRDFILYLGLIMATFLVLTLVFTFFELLSDIVRNKVPLLMVAEYLLNVTPVDDLHDDPDQRPAGGAHHLRPDAEVQ